METNYGSFLFHIGQQNLKTDVRGRDRGGSANCWSPLTPGKGASRSGNLLLLTALGLRSSFKGQSGTGKMAGISPVGSVVYAQNTRENGWPQPAVSPHPFYLRSYSTNVFEKNASPCSYSVTARGQPTSGAITHSEVTMSILFPFSSASRIYLRIR